MRRVAGSNVAWVTAPLLLLAACSDPAGDERTSPRALKRPIAVQVARVIFADVPSTYEATGTVRARTSATISAKIMGAVREVKVQAGDRVASGQLLIILDARDLESSVRRAEAVREEIKNTVPEADSGTAAAKASLDLAQLTFNRMQDLFNKRSVTNQEFDESAAKLKSAHAAYEMAQSKRAQLDAKLAQAEQEIRTAQINLSYAEISAPFVGVVSSKTVEPGNMAVPGAPLLTLEREGGYRLDASVEESRLKLVRLGQSVAVRLDYPAQSVAGKVTEISPELDAASRAGIVKIDLPAISELRSGVFARALFGSGVRRAITVPAAALVERGQLQSVLVVENGVAHSRLITAGARTGGHVEVLSGLNGGETVVVAPPDSLTDASPVEIRP